MEMLFRILLTIALVTQPILLGSCAGNFYKDLANKTTDEALYVQAKIDVNNSDYTGAISIITTQMSSSYRSKREVQNFLAGAYASRCGFDFFALFNGLSGSSTFLSILMTAYKSTTPILSDCTLSEAIMTSLTSTTIDEQTFLAVYGLGKMGLVLKTYEDTNSDGTVDSTAAACKIATISDANIDLVIKALGITITNSVALGSSAPSSIASINALCGGGCNFTSPGATERTFMRKLIDNSTYGLGTCSDNTLATCCPSP